MKNSNLKDETNSQRPNFVSMTHILQHAAQIYPKHTAIISGKNEITFADYYNCVAGLACNLIEMGAMNQRVIVLKPNSIETAILAGVKASADALVVILAAKEAISPISLLMRSNDGCFRG